MTEERPSPEAVRGSWICLTPKQEIGEVRDEAHELFAFDIGGSYRRHTVRPSGKVSQEEVGEYTFDGDFLILRGRRTHTYRVEQRESWRWHLEGKKKSRIFFRGYIEDDPRQALDVEEVRELGLMARRLRLQACVQGDDPIWELIHPSASGEQRLAVVSVDDSQNAPWVGVEPLVTGVDQQTWERLVATSVVGNSVEADGEVGVEMTLFDDGKTTQIGG